MSLGNKKRENDAIFIFYIIQYIEFNNNEFMSSHLSNGRWEIDRGAVHTRCAVPSGRMSPLWPNSRGESAVAPSLELPSALLQRFPSRDECIQKGDEGVLDYELFFICPGRFCNVAASG